MGSISFDLVPKPTYTIYADQAAAEAAEPAEGAIVYATAEGTVGVSEGGGVVSWSGEGGSVVELTAAEWDTRPDGTEEGQRLVVTDGDLVWRWKVGVGWVPDPIYGLTTVTVEGEIGTDGTLGAGWTTSVSGGGTVTEEVSLGGKSWVECDSSAAAADAASVVFNHGRTGTRSWMAAQVRLESVTLAGSTSTRFAFSDNSTKRANIDVAGNTTSGTIRATTEAGVSVGYPRLNLSAAGVARHVTFIPWYADTASNDLYAVYIDHKFYQIVQWASFTGSTLNTNFQIGETATTASTVRCKYYVRDAQVGRASA